MSYIFWQQYDEPKKWAYTVNGVLKEGVKEGQYCCSHPLVSSLYFVGTLKEGGFAECHLHLFLLGTERKVFTSNDNNVDPLKDLTKQADNFLKEMTL